MTIFVFGNPDVEHDSLPLKILPELRDKFPDIEFLVRDPNESFELPEGVIIIDTVAGLREPCVFGSLDEFQAPPNLTLHDFDLFSHLQFLKKLGKLPPEIKIIGLPIVVSKKEAINFIADLLKING